MHRIGRTGRAGATGEAISLVGPEDRPLLSAIERLIRAADSATDGGELASRPLQRHTTSSTGRRVRRSPGARANRHRSNVATRLELK